jgi:beta-galactosidase
VVTYESRDVTRSAAAGALVLAANASPCTVVDSTGVVWEPFRPDDGPGWGVRGGTPTLTRHRIFGTEDDALFQSALAGIDSVRCDLPDGDYELECRFAESEGMKPGERVFDVLANGVPLVRAFDLAADAGPFHAVSITGSCTVRGEGLHLRFVARRGRTTLSAVRITRR